MMIGVSTREYFQKWLKEDVVYIIASEERDIFQKLSTPEEKERFIEQFWQRRGPDALTAENEFRAEHYRRIAYANEHFTSGYPWRLTHTVRRNARSYLAARSHQDLLDLPQLH